MLTLVEDTFINLAETGKNRLVLKSPLYPSVEIVAGYLKQRGHYRCLPKDALGDTNDKVWQQFWNIWHKHKKDLIREGLSTRKENGQWRIYYKPLLTIELDRRILYSKFL